MGVRIAWLAAVGCAAATGASAQGANDFFGLVGGLMAQAQAQAAQEAWTREPELRRHCVQRALAREGASLPRVIQGGLLPNDPRLSRVRGECARFEPGNLKAAYVCTVPGEGGTSVPSRCNQAFARQDGFGRAQPVDPRTAIDLHFGGGGVVVTEVETDAGRQERAERAEGQRRIAELARLRDEIEPYRGSRSEAVKAGAQGLVQRAVLASNPDAPPSEAAIEALRREGQRLAQLEQMELVRLAALERLAAARARVEAKTALAAPELRDEAARLGAEYLTLARQPVAPPPPAPKPGRVGPAFACGEAKTPLARLICSDAGLSRLDLELVQPYYVLRHGLPGERDEIRQEAVDHGRRVLERCRIPEKGSLAPQAARAALPCVVTEYRRQRDLWRARVERDVAGAGRDEALRPVDDHLRLQKALLTAGLIPSTEVADGVYGAATRTAIMSLQGMEGLPADGLMSLATARRVEHRSPAAPAPDLPRPDETATRRMVALHARYVALDARLDEGEARRAREERLAARIAEGREFARAALALALPAPVQERLTRFLGDAEGTTGTPDAASLARIASEMDAMRPGVEDAVALARARTPKNAFLLDGEPGDVLVLHNDTGRAPSVVRNLRGELVFESGRTVACQPNGGVPEPSVARQVNARLRRWGQELRFPLPRCSLRAPAANDLVVVTRGELLKERAAEVATLLSAVDAGVLAPMLAVTGEEAKGAAQAEAVRVLETETAVERGEKPGFGLLALGTGSSVVCQAVAEDREAHEGLLRPHLARLAEETRGSPGFVATSVDAAFVAAKRGQCGAIYARAGDLRDLAPALRRDGVAFRYLPVWVTPEELASAKASIAEGRTREVQQEADRRRRAEDERRLRAARDGDEAVVKARRQGELQRQYGAMARAFEGALTTEMKELVEGRSDRAAGKYPAVASWFGEQLQDRWELMTVETALLDYGIAEYKGRSLETAFAQTRIKLRNRILGEYKEHCFVTGFVSDQEFAMDREPVEARCEAAPSRLATYRREQRFASRWLVE